MRTQISGNIFITTLTEQWWKHQTGIGTALCCMYELSTQLYILIFSWCLMIYSEYLKNQYIDGSICTLKS